MVTNISFRRIILDDIIFVNNTRNYYCEEYLHTSKKYSLEESYDWFKKTNPDFWIILNDNTHIGYFRLSNYSKENKNIYIGADIAKEYTGQGFAKQSYNMFIPFLFEEYNLNKISLEVLSTNQRAINLYNKLGFVKEGVKREEILKNNKWVDSIIMSILK